MRSRSLLVVLAACLMLSVAGIAAAQFTVVTVMPDGTVVLRGPAGVKSYSVPPGTTFNADGKAGTPVADLRPGMSVTGVESGIANWKAADVAVHEELNARVVAKSGNSMLIRGRQGVERFQWTSASDISIVRDGRVVDASFIRVGDRITGMIVQKATPGSTMTMANEADTAAADAAAAKEAAAEKAAADKAAAEKAAADKAAAAKAAAADKAAAKAAAADKAAADKAAADAAARAAADKAAADAAAAHAAKKKLPKTASEVPLAGMVGLLSLAAGVGLTAIRKSRSSK